MRSILGLAASVAIFLSLKFAVPFLRGAQTDLLGGNLDANGFTTFTASADTRIIYVSSSIGSDSNNGLSQNTAVATIAKGLSLIRDGSADWLLLKAGDTWVNQEFGFLPVSGRSATEPILISSYGTGARPLILTGPNSDAAIGSIQTDGSNIAIVGLEFYAYTRDPSNPHFAGPGPQQMGMNFISPLSNLLVEDTKFSFYDVNAIQSIGAMADNVILRRNIITDNYSIEGHSQGVYVYGVINLILEQNFFDHNGWNSSVAGAEATIFNHSIYIHEDNGAATVIGNIITNSSSHGAQVRPGGTVIDNLFVRDPIGLLIGGVASTVSGNVILEGNDIDGSPRGWGIDVNRSTAPIQVLNNIVAHQATNGAFGIHFAEDDTNDADIAQNNIIYQWNNPIIDGGLGNITSPNAINLTGYLDPNRTVGTYMASLGGTSTLSVFLTEARKQSRDHWRARYTASVVNEYIRAGFDTGSSGRSSAGRK